MKDRELVAFCEAQMQTALGQYEGEISLDRAKAMDYYMGEMDEYLPHEDGRSGYVSRDVLDTVEWVLPSLMKIFLDAENAVEMSAMGPEDEEQARMETDAVRHIFFEQNAGFLTLYTMFKDALLSKTGIVKTWFEEGEIEREEYKGLTPDELGKLMNDPAITVEVLEAEQTEDGTLDVTLAVQRVPGRVKVAPVPPEEFGVSPECRTPNVKDAPFVFHRTRKSASDLIEAGYSRKVVDSLPFDNDSADTEERLARYNYSDEEEEVYAVHKSMRTLWVSECYIRVDDNDDGIAELLKVTLAGESPGTTLLDREEVDRIHFATATPVILTHKAVGMSLADLVMDIQEIRSTLLRGILDNMYLSNNVRIAANELVNLDDLLVSRSGGVVRTEGETPPGQNVMPLAHPPVPQESFGLLEVLDQVIKNRTGVGDEVMGLDTDALANVNTGVMVQAYEAARMRIEMMARLLGECGVKEIFRDIHEITCKNVDRPLMLKMHQQWARVDPREWRTRENIKVNVGLGHHNRERRLMSIQDMLQTQLNTLQFGGVVQPQNLYATLVEKARAHGLAPEIYFTDPRTLPPPEPPPPDPALIQAQASMMKAETDRQRLGIDAQGSQLDAQTKMSTSQSKEREARIRAEMEEMKSKVMLRKQMVDEQSQVMNATTNQQSQQQNAELQLAKLAWDKHTDMVNAQLQQYQAELQALTQFRNTVIQAQAKRDDEVRRLREQVQQMRGNLGRSDENSTEADDGEGAPGGTGT